jgi:DNA polymerase-1
VPVAGATAWTSFPSATLATPVLTFKDICGSGKKAIPFGEVPLDRATEYAAEDADVTWRLHRVLKPRLAAEAATRVYERVDRPLVPVVAAMERHGIKVDRERLAGLSATFAEEIARLEAEIHELAGGPFTIGSPKQLGEVLFDKLGHKGGKKGKTGQYSTDQSVLEGWRAQGAEIARKVLDWRQLSKLRSTYTEALQAAINPKTGRVHTSYSLVGAQTGRLVLDRTQPAEHPDPHRNRPPDPRRLRRRTRQRPPRRRLQPDRTAARRAHGRRAGR